MSQSSDEKRLYDGLTLDDFMVKSVSKYFHRTNIGALSLHQIASASNKGTVIIQYKSSIIAKSADNKVVLNGSSQRGAHFEIRYKNGDT